MKGKTTNFYCETCNMSFYDKSGLNRHLKRPSHLRAGKPVEYYCARCDYRTNEKWNFTQHCKSFKCRGGKLDATFKRKFKEQFNDYKRRSKEYFYFINKIAKLKAMYPLSEDKMFFRDNKIVQFDYIKARNDGHERFIKTFIIDWTMSIYKKDKGEHYKEDYHTGMKKSRYDLALNNVKDKILTIFNTFINNSINVKTLLTSWKYSWMKDTNKSILITVKKRKSKKP